MSGIFISYRHEGAEALAHTIFEKLVGLGYSVFYDIESLKSEKFPERLYREIEACTDFVLILPKGGLDKCISNEKDWVRQEIAHALKHKKNIVPVIMRGFTFPENLPADIKDVSTYNGVSFESMNIFDARIQWLCDFLESKPSKPPVSAPPPPPAPPVRKSAIKKMGKAVAGLWRFLWRIMAKVCGFLWCYTFVRCVVLVFLSVSIIFYFINVCAVINNSYVDQWIAPKILFENNPYMKNIPVSRDNALIAEYNGDGQIRLIQVLGNIEDSEQVGTLQTGFTEGNILVGFSRDSNYCIATCDNRLEIFDVHTEQRVKSGEFPNADPKELIINLSWEEDFSDFIVLWADKATAELRRCAIYSDDFSLVESIDLTGFRHLGSAGEGRFLLFFDEQRDIRVIDIRNRCVVENTQETLVSECVGKIDTSSETRSCFDETGRYAMLYIPKENGYCDVIIRDMQTGDDIFSRSYFWLEYFTFSDDGTFVVLFDKKSGEDEYTARLHRVNYLKSNEPEEVLLSHEEIADKLHDSEFMYKYFDVHLFEDADSIIFGINNRLYLIDLNTKRLTASCNDMIGNGKYILRYSFNEIDENLLINVTTSDELPEWESFEEDNSSTQATVLRFSFRVDDGRVVVTEDAYLDDREPNSMVMLVVSVLAMGIFVYAGYFDRRSRGGKREQNPK